MKTGKRAALMMAALLTLGALSGCSVVHEERSESIYQPQINPMIGQNIAETITTQLYYVVEGEEQLASVTQTVNVDSG